MHKYVSVFGTPKAEFFIFPKCINHDFFLEAMPYRAYKGYRTCFSAGFVAGSTFKGKSETLGIASKTTDSQLYKEIMDQKYIVVNLDGKELIFTFPNSVMHSDMLEAIRAIRMGNHRNWVRSFRGAALVSAGFVVDNFCFGESESLGVKSRGEDDTKLLRGEA